MDYQERKKLIYYVILSVQVIVKSVVLSDDIAKINNLMAEERKSEHAASQFSQVLDSSGRTALMVAADYDKFETIKLLLELGAAFQPDEQKFVFNKLLLQLRELKVSFYGDGDDKDEIERKIAEKRELLRVFVKNKQLDWMIKADLSGPGVIRAMNLLRNDLAQVLLEIGEADVERDRDARGDTVLHRACLLRSHELIRYLTDSCEKGGLAIDPEIKNIRTINGEVQVVKPIDRVKDGDEETRKLMNNIIMNKTSSLGSAVASAGAVILRDSSKTR
jgi:ankyrin repeat protein